MSSDSITNMEENRELGISIIIPLYNVEEVILETLESIQEQTFNMYEVIMIDDGSTDRTTEIVNQYIQDKPNFRLYSQPNGGPASARNHGLRIADRMYICFVDSDDILPNYSLQLMYEAAISTGSKLITGATKRFNSNSEWFIPMHIKHNIAKPGMKKLLKNPELFFSIGPCAKLYHHSLIDGVFFPENIRYGEDQPFVLHALLQAEEIYTVEKVVYYYRLRDGESQSLTQSVNKDPIRILKSVFQIFDYGEIELEKNNTEYEVALKYYQRVASIELWGALRAAIESKKSENQEIAFTMTLDWFKSKSDDFLNIISSFRYFLLYSCIERVRYITKDNKDNYRKLIAYLWSRQDNEAKKAFQKAYPIHMNAALQIIDANNWRSARKISLKFIIRRKLKAPILIRKVSRRIIFTIASWMPRKKNQIILATERGTRLEGNLLAIYDYLFYKDMPQKVYVFLRKNRNWFEMFQLHYALGRAQTIVLDDYYNKIYGLKFNKKTHVIQSWHATGAFKKFGFSSLEGTDANTEEFETRAHSSYTDVLVSSEGIISEYADAFRKQENQIKPIGVPRTDMFFDEEYTSYVKEKYYKKYPQLRDKKILLYAPTFRGGPNERFNYSVVLDIAKMKESLGETHILILKFHPVIKNVSFNVEKDDPFILNLSINHDINDLMLFSDALITDYSSVIFEFSLMNRPMYFFAYDIDDYLDERGFYFDYKTMIPGAIFKETMLLIQAIQEEVYDYAGLDEFKKKFVGSLDGQSTKRFVETYVENSDKEVTK
ncbi:bifunctional glycosyltransferase/CDP-glycerol:glycerophosphate glycerophosphotransferase [Listeria booriae]|uniref:CDP-glycerol:glycerophosphate glycerophosphotransferase n=1 Tax=Listeria booriae TaxID=1552123 RepID=A0A7X1CZG6_9LIST|nr:CDP-glycerol:glycerophosphate glycerophosphotransferase [Listeria booriae]MBC2117339.1 CDP-glycerol:glycerophosphate glycerophosphotransferase [Listeria booriae]